MTAQDYLIICFHVACGYQHCWEDFHYCRLPQLGIIYLLVSGRIKQVINNGVSGGKSKESFASA